MMLSEVTSEAVSFGHAIYHGNLKVAVVTTSHHAGLHRNGLAICEAYPREMWFVAFTSPSFTTELLHAISDKVKELPLYDANP